MPLSMTKIAYRSGSLDNLRAWVEAGEEAHMTTRYCPKRHAEMIGGSPPGPLAPVYSIEKPARSAVACICARIAATSSGERP